MRVLSLRSCKVGHLSDNNNELILSLTFLLQGWFNTYSELLYVGSFQVCLFDFDGKDPK